MAWRLRNLKFWDPNFESMRRAVCEGVCGFESRLAGGSSRGRLPPPLSRREPREVLPGSGEGAKRSALSCPSSARHSEGSWAQFRSPSACDQRTTPWQVMPGSHFASPTRASQPAAPTSSLLNQWEKLCNDLKYDAPVRSAGSDLLRKLQNYKDGLAPQASAARPACCTIRRRAAAAAPAFH